LYIPLLIANYIERSVFKLIPHIIDFSFKNVSLVFKFFFVLVDPKFFWLFIQWILIFFQQNFRILDVFYMTVFNYIQLFCSFLRSDKPRKPAHQIICWIFKIHFLSGYVIDFSLLLGKMVFFQKLLSFLFYLIHYDTQIFFNFLTIVFFKSFVLEVLCLYFFLKIFIFLFLQFVL